MLTMIAVPRHSPRLAWDAHIVSKRVSKEHCVCNLNPPNALLRPQARDARLAALEAELAGASADASKARDECRRFQQQAIDTQNRLTKAELDLKGYREM